MDTLLERRSAIAVHHTDTNDDAWDGGAMEAACPVEAAPLRESHAWVDSEGDPDVKGSYKFIHHMVSDDSVGAANMTACSTGIGYLNRPVGATGRPDIPDSDRSGVWRHLAAHLRDGMGEDYEPPALRARFRQARELRFVTEDMEVRDGEGGAGSLIVGHAAVFNQWSEDLGGWREHIMPGAFSKTISDGADVRGLFNHDPNFVLGRTKAGTMTLSEDSHGLRYEIKAPQTDTIRDLVLEPIRRKDITQSSFSFRAIADEWVEPKALHGLYERTLSEVALFDISPVTFPAYPQTDSQVRSILAAVGIDFENLTVAMARAERGFTPSPTEIELINEAIGTLRSLVPIKPAPRGHSVESPKAGRSVAHLRRLLDLEEAEFDLL